ncbi:MAG: hypothetical protein EA387_10655 [Nitriliruptor sp.]|nr:MAG: hypothetical protein EA387_10655 [Nitriliruptor sp.]
MLLIDLQGDRVTVLRHHLAVGPATADQLPAAEQGLGRGVRLGRAVRLGTEAATGCCGAGAGRQQDRGQRRRGQHRRDPPR